MQNNVALFTVNLAACSMQWSTPYVWRDPLALATCGCTDYGGRSLGTAGTKFITDQMSAEAQPTPWALKADRLWWLI